jgi:hypothetical protein
MRRGGSAANACRSPVGETPAGPKFFVVRLPPDVSSRFLMTHPVRGSRPSAYVLRASRRRASRESRPGQFVQLARGKGGSP